MHQQPVFNAHSQNPFGTNQHYQQNFQQPPTMSYYQQQH